MALNLGDHMLGPGKCFFNEVIAPGEGRGGFEERGFSAM
jgi:hypothetical protein